MNLAGRIVAIDDPKDPRVAGYRDIRDRDVVGRDGCFIAEGEVVLRRLIGSTRHVLLSVLLAQKRIAGLMPALAGLDPGIPIYAAGQGVIDAIAGFPLHRGILALGRQAPALAAGTLLAGTGPALVVGLFGIANHDNMGGLFRNAAAFGAAGVILDSGCCDPLYRKSIRVSVGTALTLPFARLDPGQDAVALFESHGFVPLALSPTGREELADFVAPARVAALFGAEGPGLPAPVLARARSVRIAMAPGVDSLNVATTSGIVLYHLARHLARAASQPL